MGMKKKQTAIEAILKKAPVVPVMVIEDVKQAAPLARALVAGGLPVLEITLRTEAALESMRAIMAEVEGAVVGAGTVLNKEQLYACEKIGCAFAVSPGSSPRLLDAADDCAMPLLPGGVTASEIMALLERGYHFQKFFPQNPPAGLRHCRRLPHLCRRSSFAQLEASLRKRHATISSFQTSSHLAVRGWRQRSRLPQGTGGE